MKLIERILDKDNVRIALEKVITNKGAAGIDGMKVEELRGYMNANWPGIKQSILERSYRPAPVRRVEIPKPNGTHGGVRGTETKVGQKTFVSRPTRFSKVSPPNRKDLVLAVLFASPLQGNHSKFFRDFP